MDLESEMCDLSEAGIGMLPYHSHHQNLSATPSMAPTESLLYLAETLRHLDATLEQLCESMYVPPTLEDRCHALDGEVDDVLCGTL